MGGVYRDYKVSCRRELRCGPGLRVFASRCNCCFRLPCPRSGLCAAGPKTMSLSRSEEMHRLTENVYKVSPSDRLTSSLWLGSRPGGPGAQRPGPSRGLPVRPLGAGVVSPAPASHRWPPPPDPLRPSRPTSPLVLAGAPTPTAPLGPRAPPCVPA